MVSLVDYIGKTSGTANTLNKAMPYVIGITLAGGVGYLLYCVWQESVRKMKSDQIDRLYRRIITEYSQEVSIKGKKLNIKV